MSRKALGRGLRALIPEAIGTLSDVREISIHAIRANENQPRRRFDPAALAELSESIKQHGVLEPLIVRPVGTDYEIVVGERRWRAAQMAGLETVPALVRHYDDREATEIALVENLQREDLNPIEEAEAYQRLIDLFGLTQEEVAQRVGRERSTVANRLRLLFLEPEIREMIEAGSITAGHAKALLGAEPGKQRVALARMIAEQGLSVRQVEELIRKRRQPKQSPKRIVVEKDPHWEAIESEFRDVLGTKVNVVHRGDNRGKIEIEFYSAEDIERILSILRRAL